MHAALQRGTLSLDALALWWAEENAAEALTSFVLSEFSGSTLLERYAVLLGVVKYPKRTNVDSPAA